MTKRLLSLLLATVLVLSLVLTACSSSEEDEVDDDLSTDLRNNIAITIYGITEDDTTKEAIALVEEKISNYCFAKMKTKIDLRLYKESDYQAALDAMYDKFNEQDEAKRVAAEAAASASKSLRAYKKTLTPEELAAYEKSEREAAREKEKEAKKALAEQQALIRAGRDEAVLNDVQMDILYIPSAEDYYAWVEEELLVELSEQFRTTLNQVYTFEYPAFLTAANVDGGVYGIPNNKAITTDYTYIVANTELAEKYEVDWDKVHSIRDLEPVFEAIKANEPGVTPILGDFDPENVEFLELPGLTDFGHTLAIYADQLLGANFAAINARDGTIIPNYCKSWNITSNANSFFYKDYAELKWQWRSKGYLADAGDYFVTILEMTDEEAEAKREEGLTVVPYKGAKFTTADALSGGLYGISVRSAHKLERVAEVLDLFVTDPEFRNLFAFGVEGVHYVKDAEYPNVITVIDDSYSMDFFRTGNTFIGYIPDTMDPDYVEKGIQKNVDSRIDPSLGFRFDWDDPDNKKDTWFEIFNEWSEGTKEGFEKIMYGVENYEEIFTELSALCSNYTDMTNSCNFRTAFGSNYTRLLALDTRLHPEVKQ